MARIKKTSRQMLAIFRKTKMLSKSIAINLPTMKTALLPMKVTLNIMLKPSRMKPTLA